VNILKDMSLKVKMVEKEKSLKVKSLKVNKKI